MEFDAEKNGPLHQQKWAIDEMKKFNDYMYTYNQYFCLNCHEMWPSTLSKCIQCSKDGLKFSKVNFKWKIKLC